MIKTTPLTEDHKRLGAKLVEFAGWYMPVQYRGIREEHLCVRNSVGIFDVSHMGEIFIRGDKALETVEWMTTNQVSRLDEGQAQYTLLLNKKGGVVDDLIVYCLKKRREYLICVNASNIEKDHQWVLENNLGAQIANESEEWGQIAVQGPKSYLLIEKALSLSMFIPSFNFLTSVFNNEKIYVAKTGYTGEEGVEIFAPKNQLLSLWHLLLELGSSFNLQPIGLGARDTLRLEMAYCLYGHELTDETNPYETGLGWVIKPKEKKFLGMEPLLRQKEMGLKQKLIGFVLLDKGIPRQGYSLISFDKKEIGTVTSGTLSPSLEKSIGLGYVDSKYADLGSEIYVDIRGRSCLAKIVKTPFVKTKGV